MSPKKRRYTKPSSSKPPLPPPPEDSKPQIIPTIVEKTTKQTKKRSYTVVFIIGGLVGLLLAAGLVKNQDIVIRDFPLGALVDVIPAGILKEATDISVCQSGNMSCNGLPVILTNALERQQREKDVVSADAFSVGLALKAEGLEANHPVIMVC